MDREALRRHVLEHSVRRGEFTLKSGQRSTWFLDTKQTACRPDGILLVAEAALPLIPTEATAIGGLDDGRRPRGLRDRRGRGHPRAGRCAASACARRPRTTG